MPVKNEVKKFRLELSDPMRIHQGAEGDIAWGHYQFPILSYTTKGSVLLEWGYHNDSVLQDGHSAAAVTSAVSDDGGKTWRAKGETDLRKAQDLLMDNGKCFHCFLPKAGYEVDFLDRYVPAAVGQAKVYFAEDLQAEIPPLALQGVEKDPVTGEETVFPIQLHWPHRPIVAFSEYRTSSNILVPTEYPMSNCSEFGLIKMDDGLYYCMYTEGFDSTAASREEAVMKYSGYYHIYIFKSTDNGRTWHFLSQINTDDSVYAPGCEGLCEPMMRQMPDGSVVILMRSGGGIEPKDYGYNCYISRSVDHCRTWSKPEVFDSVGVLPQLLPLKCGVTLATYGRPGLYLKATGDPCGLVWETPIEIPLSEGPEWRSCYYTNLLPLDDHTALFAYTDFHHPLPSGKGEGKAILVRTITVQLEE